jgi:hypothetical protein
LQQLVDVRVSILALHSPISSFHLKILKMSFSSASDLSDLSIFAIPSIAHLFPLLLVNTVGKASHTNYTIPLDCYY